MQTFKELRAQTHAFLDEFGEEGLDRPTKSQPPGFSGMETAGKAIIDHRRPRVRPSRRADSGACGRRNAATVRPVGSALRVLVESRPERQSLGGL